MANVLNSTTQSILRGPVQAVLGPVGNLILKPEGGFGAGGFPYAKVFSMQDASLSSSLWSDDGKTTNSGEGGAVAVWADISGNGNDIWQTNASYRPVYELASNRINSVGGGVQTAAKWMTHQDMSSWSAGSFFAKLQVYGGQDGGIWGTAGTSSAGSAAHWNYALNGAHSVQFAENSTTQGSFAAWGVGNIPAWDALMTFESQQHGDGTVSEYADGFLGYGPTDRGTAIWRAAPYIGSCVRFNSPQYAANIYWHKFCAFDSIITDEAERTEIYAWLNS